MSDQAGILSFHPRARDDGAPVVWAISDERLPNYLVPRDCPRVAFWRGPETTEEDANRFLIGSRHVIAIEQAWFRKCLESKVFLYEFDPSSFQAVDPSAGYYTSTESVKPIAEHEVSDIFDSLFCRGVEVRVLPTLWYLREEIAASSLGFSIIRMRNAGPMPIGFQSRFEVPR